MHHTQAARGRMALHYALETLHALPCGCVAAVYRAQPLDTEIIAVEARGPHCVYSQHEIGRVLGLNAGGHDQLSR